MTTFDDHEINLVRRVECEENGLYFARYFFKQRYSAKMMIEQFHRVMQQALDRTMLPFDHPDYISRLILNIPPGYGKTDMAVINYMSRGLGINPRSRFLHLSYSQSLALLNSSVTREIVTSQPYQSMWPLGIKHDTKAKEMWHTSAGGGVNARATGGQVTGFRAGHMERDLFTGALIIDDPIKPDDAHSDVMRNGVNERYQDTIASRLAIEEIPIIIVMQRVHYDDLSGYLLKGGSGEKWHHLNMPVFIDEAYQYPEEYTHGIEIKHNLQHGWLWPYKHNEKHRNALESHRRKFAAQYMQKPLKRDEFTALWSEPVINKARCLSFSEEFEKQKTVVAIDPATTNTEQSDEHGIVVASKYGKMKFSVDADYTKRGSPLEWAKQAIYAYEAHNADYVVIETNQGGDLCEANLRNAGFKGRIKKVHAKKGKTLRAEPVAALYEQNFVEHVRGSGLSKLENEQMDFDPVTQKSNGSSPNRVDAVVYALTDLADIGTDLGNLLDLAMGKK